MPSNRKNRRPRPQQPAVNGRDTIRVNDAGQPETVAEAAPLEALLEGIGAATQYMWPVPFRCSAGCGQSIRQGHLAVQTSPDLHPLERAHLVCLLNRKGVDSDRAEDGMPVAEVAA